MKAKIQGIEVEGTPQEIAEFKLQVEKQLNKGIEKFTYPNYEYHFPPVYIGEPILPYKLNQVTCDSKPKM